MLLFGPVHSGIQKHGDTHWALDPDVGGKVKILGRSGLERIERGVAGAGGIMSVAGVKMRSGAGGSCYACAS